MLRLCVILLPALVLAAGSLKPVTVLPSEKPVTGSEAVVSKPTRPAEQTAMRPLVGHLDTVGGTTYDWQATGPIWRFLVNAPTYGLHVLWMYSADPGSIDFPDRNMRYNYCDFAAGQWSWIDPNYMESGQNVFYGYGYHGRSGYGSLDYDPLTGVAIASCHGTHDSIPGSHPEVARDIAPGAGIFEYACGRLELDGCGWPPISVGQSSTIHTFCITPTYGLAYSRIQTWPTFDPVRPVGELGFPTHSVAASKVSNHVCVLWENQGSYPEDAAYKVSTDGGTTWPDSATRLAPPVAYGGDTVTSFHLSSLFPFYDSHNRLHIVASVMPIVNDTGYVLPAEIWHWCPENSPPWSEVHRAGCDPSHLLGSVGYNAIYATRPSIGEAYDNDVLCVVWEQFDSVNVEPLTQCLRADIFLSYSCDDGETWAGAEKLTDAGTASCRFPCIVDRFGLTCTSYQARVVYEVDRVAGFYVQGQGPGTENPIVVHWIDSTGIAESPVRTRSTFELQGGPNPVRGAARLEYALPRAGAVRLEVFDLSGRQVALLQNGRKSAGRYSAVWRSSPARPGVYLARLTASGQTMTRKLVLTE